MKRLFKSLTLILALAGIYFLARPYFSKNNVIKTTYNKRTGDQEDQEKKSATVTKKRAPAAIAKTNTPLQNPKKAGPFFPRKNMNRFKGLKTINTPSPKWKDNLKSGIFRFGFTAENFKINHIESVARKEGKKVRNLEWVKISYTQKGFPQMYDALVDSASGRVIQTWNHVKYEPMFNRHRKLSFSLGGLLKDADAE